MFLYVVHLFFVILSLTSVMYSVHDKEKEFSNCQSERIKMTWTIAAAKMPRYWLLDGNYNIAHKSWEFFIMSTTCNIYITILKHKPILLLMVSLNMLTAKIFKNIKSILGIEISPPPHLICNILSRFALTKLNVII